MSTLKESIIQLRSQGKPYKEIQNTLKCAKSTISYYCQNLENNNNLIQDNLSKKGFVKSKALKIINTWDEKIKHNVEEIGKFKINRKEISKLFNLDIDAVKLFLKNKKTCSIKNKGYDSVKNRRKITKIMAIIYKGGKCSKCTYNKNYSSLDFHHLDPSKKEFAISKCLNKKWENVKKEVDKCIILCKNCHGELHNPTNILPNIKY